MDSRFAGKKILLLDGLTSQCLEYTKAFNGLGCVAASGIVFGERGYVVLFEGWVVEIL